MKTEAARSAGIEPRSNGVNLATAKEPTRQAVTTMESHADSR